ncbi:nucleotidyltransferase family protein [Clostridium boliviensis]|uniref:Nucleotidyltransferase family protein n=1 Tax=Clostridium boliviensis TaxID=318465 RepID=A0ABU4GEB5_9CLOT|nr:nucleotidyltransferase family protein [Clostridium boliviensis]MDW2795970.1 nucleotidyltransferase family protein [Clostridium boliviensis]
MNMTLILLAAGDSLRFNGNKLLYEMNGKPMYRCIIEEIDQLPGGLFTRKLIVTQYDEIMDYMKDSGYKIIVNKDSKLGISHSIHLALKELENEDTDFLFAVCDQPYLHSSTIESLVRGFKGSKKGLACLSCEGELGNPALFSSRYRKELMELKGDKGGKRIIRAHMSDVFLLEAADPAELQDIDIRPR